MPPPASSYRKTGCLQSFYRTKRAENTLSLFRFHSGCARACGPLIVNRSPRVGWIPLSAIRRSVLLWIRTARTYRTCDPRFRTGFEVPPLGEGDIAAEQHTHVTQNALYSPFARLPFPEISPSPPPSSPPGLPPVPSRVCCIPLDPGRTHTPTPTCPLCHLCT
jgi:hypothetical protein